MLFARFFSQDTERRDSIPEEDTEQHHNVQGQSRQMNPIYEIDKQTNKEAVVVQKTSKDIDGGDDEKERVDESIDAKDSVL